MLTNNWCYFIFIIAAAVLGGGDNLLSLSYGRFFFFKKKTGCAIAVGYGGAIQPSESIHGGVRGAIQFSKHGEVHGL